MKRIITHPEETIYELAAIAVVAGNRFVKNQDNNEKNSRETEKVDVAEKKVEVKKETSLQKEATEISETTEITEAAVNTETQKTSDFYISKIPDDIFEKMQGKSYKADCTVPRDELRYVHVLHMGFDGQTKEGELVVNKAIADDVLAIFEELYQADYPIEKVELVDAYNADDEESMSHNNSFFCYCKKETLTEIRALFLIKLYAKIQLFSKSQAFLE